MNSIDRKKEEGIQKEWEKEGKKKQNSIKKKKKREREKVK